MILDYLLSSSQNYSFQPLRRFYLYSTIQAVAQGIRKVAVSTPFVVCNSQQSAMYFRLSEPLTPLIVLNSSAVEVASFNSEGAELQERLVIGRTIHHAQTAYDGSRSQ